MVAGIRDARAPASLKRGTVCVAGGLYLHRHPGRARPGLIEAATIRVTRCLTLLGIRDARAPASLKHPRQRFVRRRVRVGIRDARAPASLKRLEPQVVDRDVRQGIRDARAPASLKRPGRRPACDGRRGHPGRARPGLIEAGLPLNVIPNNGGGIRDARAPASLKRGPRRHLRRARGRHPGRARPGLIEATSSGRSPSRTCRIRDARAPASLKHLPLEAGDPVWLAASGTRAPRPH